MAERAETVRLDRSIWKPFFEKGPSRGEKGKCHAATLLSTATVRNQSVVTFEGGLLRPSNRTQRGEGKILSG